ncbi:MAG TPA: hypothetical protein VLE73_01940 [Candidatus Saccharimonadales bacterium]|nr:hypothetical protein [Candidatus Saccharimonadales bacterium]
MEREQDAHIDLSQEAPTGLSEQNGASEQPRIAITEGEETGTPGDLTVRQYDVIVDNASYTGERHNYHTETSGGRRTVVSLLGEGTEIRGIFKGDVLSEPVVHDVLKTWAIGAYLVNKARQG